MAGDVLQKDSCGSALADDARDVRPQVASIVHTIASSGEAERLAGIARRDEMNDATPAVAVEAGKVVPDRSRSQDALAHARDQDCGRMGFPLHETDGAVGVSEGEVEPEFQPADSGT